MTQEPRYFWRRFFALIVDLFLASILAMLFALPLTHAAPEKLRLSEGLFRVHLCQPITSFPQVVTDYIDGREVAEASFCRYRPNLVFPPQYVAEIKILEPKEPGARINRYVELEIATLEDGTLIEPVAIDEVLTALILLLGAAAFLVRGRATPGKALLGLQIVGEGCALCREVRRVGPFVLFSSLETALMALGVGLTVPVAIHATIVLIILAAAAYYYLWPLIRWRGAMRYDRASGFIVTRKSVPPAITP
ncbi:MAG: hypothetical protein AAGA08_13385 [Pseudomonadota bacterium]